MPDKKFAQFGFGRDDESIAAKASQPHPHWVHLNISVWGWTVKVTDDDDDEWRRQRLSRLVGYLMATAPGSTKISELNDHEGQLTVTWAVPPTSVEMDAVLKGWGMQNEVLVIHEDISRRLIREDCL